MEISGKRTLNSKHFQLENGEIKGEFHGGHVHYFNKLGVGNSVNDYRSIDWTLHFDEIKRGWGFEYHSFHPFFPEFADGWVYFRDLFEDKDQTVGFKAHASHVLGRLVMPEDIGLKDTNVNCVIYDDAFGEGKDLILYFYRSELKKVVRIREAYKGTEDLAFTFDIFLDDGLNVWRGDNTGISYLLDLNSSKSFDTNKQTLIGKNTEGSFTYLKEYKVWDSGENLEQKVRTLVVYFNAENFSLTKNIPADFIANSIGDIFADTTTSYYGNSDADIYNINATFSTAHDAASGTARTGTTLYSQYYNFVPDGGYVIDRVFLNFITSGIGAGNTISSATLNIYSLTSSVPVSYTGGVYGSTCSDPVVNGDFDQFGTVAFSTDIMQSNWASAVNTYIPFAFNASGIAGISKTGTSSFSIIATEDAANTAPASGVLNNWRSYMAGAATAGTSQDPYLSVTYAPAVSNNSNFFHFF